MKLKKSDKDDKHWILSLHPVALFCVPVCIPKLRSHFIETGLITKQSVQTSLQQYSRLAVDWFDVMTSHRVTTKYTKYDMFDSKYHPQDTKTQYMRNCASLQPTFEMDLDSVVFNK